MNREGLEGRWEVTTADERVGRHSHFSTLVLF